MGRMITLDILDDDAKKVFNLAAGHGLTVAELIENFVGDLVCGNRRNGSDECDCAKQWFNRCWFGMFPEYTFIHYLIDWWEIENFIDDLEFMDDMEMGDKDAESDEEKADYQLDYDSAKVNIVDYYNEYIQNCPKDEKPQSYDDAINAIRKYKEDLSAWMG